MNKNVDLLKFEGMINPLTVTEEGLLKGGFAGVKKLDCLYLMDENGKCGNGNCGSENSDCSNENCDQCTCTT